MDDWGWEQIEPWQRHRLELPVGPFLCVIDGATRGRIWSPTGARSELRRLAVQASVRRRFAPHQLRHAHAVEVAREGVPLPVIQRQPGHAHLGVTSTYLQGIDTTEIINTVHARRPPRPARSQRRLHHRRCRQEFHRDPGRPATSRFHDAAGGQLRGLRQGTPRQPVEWYRDAELLHRDRPYERRGLDVHHAQTGWRRADGAHGIRHRGAGISEDAEFRHGLFTCRSPPNQWNPDVRARADDSHSNRSPPRPMNRPSKRSYPGPPAPGCLTRRCRLGSEQPGADCSVSIRGKSTEVLAFLVVALSAAVAGLRHSNPPRSCVGRLTANGTRKLLIAPAWRMFSRHSATGCA